MIYLKNNHLWENIIYFWLFSHWSMSHPLTWRRQVFWPTLQYYCRVFKVHKNLFLLLVEGTAVLFVCFLSSAEDKSPIIHNEGERRFTAPHDRRGGSELLKTNTFTVGVRQLALSATGTFIHVRETWTFVLDDACSKEDFMLLVFSSQSDSSQDYAKTTQWIFLPRKNLLTVGVDLSLFSFYFL